MEALLFTIDQALAQAEEDYADDTAVRCKSVLQAWRAAKCCVQAALDSNRSRTYVQYQLCGHRTAQCVGHVSYSTLRALLPTLRQLTCRPTVK